MSDEITVTLTNLSGHTEAIPVSSTGTSLRELAELSCALLGMENSNDVTLTVDGRLIYTNSSANSAAGGAGEAKVGVSGIKNGDVVLVGKGGRGGERTQRNVRGAQQAQQQVQGNSSTTQQQPTSGGTLDFSSLLASAGAGGAAAPAPPPPAAAVPAAGGLSFNLPGLEAAAASATYSAPTTTVEWDRMTLDDAIRSNPNPAHLVPLLLSDRHPNLIKELNYHSPKLATKIKEAGPGEAGIKVWREQMMVGGIQGAMQTTMTQTKEREMQSRLKSNPNDVEAKAYFEEKKSKRDVDAQYRQMMEEYPESMGRVLMLYIESEVNGHPLQAFVDSGAQSTIMSSACAKRCELLHLLDRRFAGTAVGVGTGKILGRIHITPLKIKGHYFPCSITVMDSDEGLGDKNMDFLFGLDMLKRHRCRIDLALNSLVFTLPEGRTLEAPFLHEKDLDEKKGGTRGFDAEKANAELARQMEEEEKDAKTRAQRDEESGYEGGESEAMDVDESKDEGGVAKKKREE